MTHQRVVAVVISVWVFSAFVFLMILWGSLSTQNLVLLIVGVICLLLTSVIYIRIYLVARRHKNQIQTLQVQAIAHSAEMIDPSALLKSTFGLLYVYLVFLVCYLPYCISAATIEINGPSIALNRSTQRIVSVEYLFFFGWGNVISSFLN